MEINRIELKDNDYFRSEDILHGDRKLSDILTPNVEVGKAVKLNEKYNGKDVYFARVFIASAPSTTGEHYWEHGISIGEVLEYKISMINYDPNTDVYAKLDIPFINWNFTDMIVGYATNYAVVLYNNNDFSHRGNIYLDIKYTLK